MNIEYVEVDGKIYTVGYSATHDFDLNTVDIKLYEVDKKAVDFGDVDLIQSILSYLEHIENPQYLRECKAEEEGEDYYENSFF